MNKICLLKGLLAFILLGACDRALAAGGGANVIHVNRTATGSNDGSDWGNAYTNIGGAIGAISGSKTNIWITGGTYSEGGLLTLSTAATRTQIPAAFSWDSWISFVSFCTIGWS